MKREILFRGKRSNGKWVYGSLVVSENTAPAIYYEVGKGVVKQLDWCYVNPDTIGQYTGVKDKNGKKIFEGDIVGNNGFVHLIKYVGNFAGFFTVSRELRGSFGYFDQKWIDYCDIVVIGNVTDNPELMK